MACFSPTVRFFCRTEIRGGVDNNYTAGTALDVLVSCKNTNLQEVSIDDCISLVSMNHILTFQQLRLLQFTGGLPVAFDPAYVHKLSTLPHLKELELAHRSRDKFHPVSVGGFASLERGEIIMNSTNAQNILRGPACLSSLAVYDIGVEDGGRTIRTAAQLRSFLKGWHQCISVLAYRQSLKDIAFIFKDRHHSTELLTSAWIIGSWTSSLLYFPSPPSHHLM
jgi:hypothetical protein